MGTRGHGLGAAGHLCPLLWEQGLEGGQLLGARGSPGQAESFWGWLEQCSPMDVSASSDRDSMRTPGNAGAGAFPVIHGQDGDLELPASPQVGASMLMEASRAHADIKRLSGSVLSSRSSSGDEG